MNNKKELIIKPFNKVYIGLFLFNVALTIVGYFCVKRITRFDTRKIVIAVSYINFLLFFFYRLSMKDDKEYIDLIYSDYGKINWYNELPLYPCNVMMMVNPINLIFGKRYMLAFSFFFSLIAPIPALLSPCTGFENYDLKKPRMFGYYGTHYLCIINSLLLVFSGIYVPRYSDIVPACLIFLGASLIITLFNVYLIKTEKNPEANYFFTMNP
ncbi:MAG: YwaF family protein, partial [Erysipelotrichaceae bacterium]|nr:YwaF family protein [Erysipelotrichaceae bacterium]